jgi:hypothetical protein
VGQYPSSKERCIMTRVIVGLSVLFCLTPALMHAWQPQQQEHGRYDFPVAVGGHEYVLTYEGTHDYALKKELVDLGGSGGAIALDKNGNFATPRTEKGMYRGWVRGDGVIEVRIYER